MSRFLIEFNIGLMIGGIDRTRGRERGGNSLSQF